MPEWNWREAYPRDLQTAVTLPLAMALEQCLARGLGENGLTVAHNDGFDLWAFGRVSDHGALAKLRANGTVRRCGDWYVCDGRAPVGYAPPRPPPTPAPGVYAGWFLDGDYIVTIERTGQKISRLNKRMFVIEALIETSTNHERHTGVRAAQVIDLDGIWGPARLRQFAALANDIRDKTDDELVQHPELEPGALSLCLSDFNPFAGVRLWLSCHTLRPRGRTFMHHTWGPVERSPFHHGFAAGDGI